MPMTVVVTRDVADRYRGFVASIMPEIAPGVYVAADLTKGVRERLWGVLSEWWNTIPGGSIILTWRDNTQSSGIGILSLGLPPVSLSDLDGVLVVHRPLSRGRSSTTAKA